VFAAHQDNQPAESIVIYLLDIQRPRIGQNGWRDSQRPVLFW